MTTAPGPPPGAIDELLDARYRAASAAACRYVRWLSAGVLGRCGLAAVERGPLAQVGASLGVAPELHQALAWLLAEAAGLGAVEVSAVSAAAAPEETVLFAAGPPLSPELGERIAGELARHAGLVGSSLPLLDHVAACYPDVLQGRRSGHLALLKGGALRLWESYFSAANPLYDVHNQLAWTGLRQALERLGRPARVLELGVGTGGGTAALLTGLAGLAGDGAPRLAGDGAPRLAGKGAPRLAALTLSDVSPSFAVNTAQRLGALAPAGTVLQARRLDFSQPLLAQGVEPGSVDVLIGVNAVHNGGDLGETLAALRGALAADGWLVISESLCPPDGRVHQDFIFNLLPPPRRGAATASRFFAAETWRAALRDGRWRAEVLVNREGPELALLALAQPGLPPP